MKYIPLTIFFVYLMFVASLAGDIGETVSIVITPRVILTQLFMRVFVFALGAASVQLFRTLKNK